MGVVFTVGGFGGNGVEGRVRENTWTCGKTRSVGELSVKTRYSEASLTLLFLGAAAPTLNKTLEDLPKKASSTVSTSKPSKTEEWNT